jgi:hypothetical protein
MRIASPGLLVAKVIRQAAAAADRSRACARLARLHRRADRSMMLNMKRIISWHGLALSNSGKSISRFQATISLAFVAAPVPAQRGGGAMALTAVHGALAASARHPPRDLLRGFQLVQLKQKKHFRTDEALAQVQGYRVGRACTVNRRPTWPPPFGV